LNGGGEQAMPQPTIDPQITTLYAHDLAQTARFQEETTGLQLRLVCGACRIYFFVGDPNGCLPEIQQFLLPF
jgi:hypothetical protein